MSDSVPKIPDFVTQVTRDEDNEDYSGGISARRIPGEEPDLPQYEDDYGSSSSSAPANDSIFSRIFCCFGGGASSSSSTAKALPPIPPGGKYLLPPQFPHHKGRKCLVLDLDETLVHSSFRPVPNADFVIPVEIEDTVHQVYVSKRPNVDEFMRKMGEIYEIVIFTASLNKYADPVLDLLDIHKVVAHRLFRDSCCNNRGNYVKDMARLGRVMSQSIIIDNSPTSFMFQPELAIAIDSWFDDVNDTELDQLVPFLTELASADDVRPGLREWAQKKQWKG